MGALARPRTEKTLVRCRLKQPKAAASVAHAADFGYSRFKTLGSARFAAAEADPDARRDDDQPGNSKRGVYLNGRCVAEKPFDGTIRPVAGERLGIGDSATLVLSDIYAGRRMRDVPRGAIKSTGAVPTLAWAC